MAQATSHWSPNRFEVSNQTFPFPRAQGAPCEFIWVLQPCVPCSPHSPLLLTLRPKAKSAQDHFPPLISHFHFFFPQPFSLTMCSHRTKFGGSERSNPFPQDRFNWTGFALNSSALLRIHYPNPSTCHLLLMRGKDEFRIIKTWLLSACCWTEHRMCCCSRLPALQPS